MILILPITDDEMKGLSTIDGEFISPFSMTFMVTKVMTFF